LLHEQSPGPLVTKNPEQLTPQALRGAILAVPCCLANNSTANNSTANNSTANNSTANNSTANNSTANNSTAISRLLDETSNNL
jgi:hypothetical protein